ncbi:uncharacterized protein HMPREF1541_10534 [Cyphellophora europaea CBS 101466]|uniref:Zn(2)-C6 fungal-type domain-containing protein n=1 Tax=Cyphellophora europaea (strain CBS 101466) TaxID=1220924 RepID=W2S8W0_CYPE1|nr:uncharacterized protein HMPREF1541_10534 [Cyphellophora europaea CBS 101466]ETN44354.1 hypothetical protein HMPREF1541_10534 [Cyphellophora europaea CBS 101466]
MPTIPPDAVTSWRLKPPPSKPTKPRIRAWTPKTRTGCLTCKQRRVKCDETKPKCKRCINGNFRCEGYADAKTWLFESDSLPSKSPSTSSSSDSDSASENQALTVIPSILANEVGMSERRSLKYFTERAQPELATFTYSAAHFWNNIIPKLYQTNSTVRSAVIAASSLHEATRHRDAASMSPATNQLYLKHYSKAVQDLTRQDSPPSRDIILMSCLIFLTCENLLESAPGVLIHLQAGLQVLREWHNTSNTHPTGAADSVSDVLLNYLEPIFARLEAQSSLIPIIPNKINFNAYDLNWKKPDLPKSFANLNIARNCMHDVIQYCWFQGKQSTGLFLPSNPVYRHFLYQLTQWDVIFTTSFPNHDSPTWPYYRTATALRIHVQALSLAFRQEGFQDPTWIDSQYDHMASIVDRAEDIILAGLPPRNKLTYGFDDIWTHDFCLQPPLMLLALHCRHPLLRRRVVHLKRLHHCWYDTNESYMACNSARMLQMVMNIEERGPLEPPRSDDNEHGCSLNESLPPSSSFSSSYPDPNASAKVSTVPIAHRIRPLRVILNIPYKVALEYNYLRDPPPNPLDPQQGRGSVLLETLDVPSWAPPPIPYVVLFPFAEMIVHGNFQGMIRPVREHCLCRSLGGPQERMWRE